MESQTTEKAKATDIYTVLGTALITEMVEATEIFSLIGQTNGVLSFWHRTWDGEYTIPLDWTVEKLVEFIAEHSYELGLYEGKRKIQNQMRSALGL